MKDLDLEKVARDPRFAPVKNKKAKQSRSTKQLFEDVDQEATFKDMRGRPWLKNPRAYAKAQVAKIADDETHAPERSSSEDEEMASQNTSEDESAQSCSSETSREELSPTEVIADLYDADWYELTKDAQPVTATSRRLALLHFDWDNAKAENIYMVLESFLPARGHIERVTIYPSEFGIQRMTEETTQGPHELLAHSSSSSDDEPTKQSRKMETNKGAKRTHSSKRTEEGDMAMTNNEDRPDAGLVELDEKAGWRTASKRLRRRIRQYQLARLKYFYAIIEFDSVETAETIYQACDGFEYESSGARLDLRFVSDDDVFSVPPEHAHLISECREINKAKYVSRPFETSALHSTRVGISWDKTPDERTGWLRDQFKPEVDPQSLLHENRDQLEKYIALSSSGASTAASSDVDEPPPAPTVPRIRRHRPKTVPPADLRAALLGIDCGTFDSGSDVREDEEEEVFDLNDAAEKDDTNPGEVEEYDLRPSEKTTNKAKSTNSRIARTILPEAMDEFSHSSDAMESDDEKQKERSVKTAKSKRKEKQKSRQMAKKRKIMERLEKQATLWSNPDIPDKTIQRDTRFDAFLTDPGYKISQTHPDYKEANEFIQYMRSQSTSSQNPGSSHS